MQITSKKVLSEVDSTRVTRMEIRAPLIAKKARPGQFIVLIVSRKGERIPLTVVEANISAGTITLIFQEIGLTTKLLGKLNIGDSVYALTGPLGHATEIKKYGRVILVGGGVGIAEIYPVAKAMKEAGNKVITIIGARTRDLLILESELKAISDELHLATDDGSYGMKGFTTDILRDVVGLGGTAPPGGGAGHSKTDNVSGVGGGADLVYTVGPIPMMSKVSSITRPSGVKTLASLNALMVDATGMCGSCRVTVGGKVKFSCVDGPEFDAHLVDWEELDKRSKIYLEKERREDV